MNLADTSLPPAAAPPDAQPKYRFNNAKNLLAVLRTAAKRVDFQVEQDRLVGDAYDRMPPIPSEELARRGEEWRTNVDYGDTENALNEKAELLVNLATKSLPLISYQTKLGFQDPGVSAALNTAALGYDSLLRNSDFFNVEVQNICHQMAATGLGVAHFPDPFSWKFESQPRCNLIYPPRAPMNPDKWPWIAVRTNLAIDKLIDKLRNKEAAETLGWDTSVILKVLRTLKNGTSIFQGNQLSIDENPEFYVNALLDNDVYFASENGSHIKAFTVYTKEFDGKVSTSIIVDGETTEFLYRGKQFYERMSKAVTLFPLSLGQNYLEKVRGLGHRILPYNALLNDVRNRSVDLTILSGGLMLKGTKEDGLRDASQLLMGGLVTLIPEEYSLDQRSFSNPAQGLIAMDEMLRSRREANNRVFGGAGGATKQKELTATHAKLMYSEEMKGNGFETDRFYEQLTCLHQNVWERLEYFAEKGNESAPCDGRDEALDFWKELKEAGVRKTDLDQIKRVAANSLFGDGDPAQVFLALGDLWPVISTLPETVQRQAKKMMIAARTRKPYLAEEWLPTNPTGDRELSHQLWRVSVEHDAFENGSPMPVQDDDLPAVHAEQHTVWAEEVLAGFENGIMGPQDALKRLVLCRDHTAFHLSALAVDEGRKPLLADLNVRWQSLSNMMVRMEQMVGEQQEAERQRQLEELRNPSLTVADQQKILTEETKRNQLVATEETRRNEIMRTEEMKRDLMSRGALTEAQIKTIESLPVIPEAPAPTA